MTSSPNWQKLAQMGKLPKDQFDKVPFFNLVCDDCKEKIFNNSKQEVSDANQEAIKQEVSDNLVSINCDKCEYIAKGKSEALANNKLRLHMKSHNNEK